MVLALQSNAIIKSNRVAAAMSAIDRLHYVPGHGSPYQDAPQGIGCNATISAPHMHAATLEMAEPHLISGARVLDVGSGSGVWMSYAATLVQPNGVVYGVEHVPELVSMSIRNFSRDPAAGALRDAGVLRNAVVGDGRKGLPQFAPYDVIHVGAGCNEGVPPALLDQLAPGGVLVAPVATGYGGQQMQVISKDAGGGTHVQHSFGVQYVPLTSLQSQIGAAF